MNILVKQFIRRVLRVVALLPLAALGAETVQPGFVLHDEGKGKLAISSVRSGELCAGMAAAPDGVCNTGTRLVVQGEDTCAGTDNQTYTCTRYGYRYDYSGATPNTQIECTAKRRDPFNERQKTYTIPISSESGSVFEPQWIPYSRVDRRAMLTEVHSCTYLGEPLATIEYIIVYEPAADPAPVNARHPDIDEPYAPGVPKACNYLDGILAQMWVGQKVIEYTAANEHFPILRSHCAWFGAKELVHIAKMEHKFHLYRLFDVENLRRDQLLFHAAFAAGGHYPVDVLTDLGKITFVYELPEEDRSAISVVTGIQGPPTNAGDPMELLAHYHLRSKTRNHEQRLACLLDLATKSLDLWFSLVQADNTVILPDEPEDLRASCP